MRMISQVTPEMRLYTDTPLEVWRAESFYTKEPETLAWIHDMEGGVYWDIGANIGVYAIYAALLHPQMVVYAFEPELRNFCRLVDNIALNNLTNVHPFNVAISNANWLEAFYVRDSEVGNSGGQISEPICEDEPFKPCHMQRVIALTLGTLSGMCCHAPDYVKVDVDGQEHRVIEKLPYYEGRIRSVLIEMNGSPEKRRHMTEYLCSTLHLTTDNPYNRHEQHSRIRRQREGITAENVIFTRI